MVKRIIGSGGGFGPPGKRGLGIAWKITAMVVATTISALLISGIAFIWYQSYNMKENMRNSMEVLAEMVSNNSSATIAFGDKITADETLASLRAIPDIDAAALYVESGELFSTFEKDLNVGHLPQKVPPDGVRFIEKHMYISAPVMLDGERKGTTYLVVSMDSTYKATIRTAFIVGGVILLTIIAAVAMAIRLQKLVSQPITDLATAAYNVSKSGDYSVRVKGGSDDEQGMLADAFNEMLEQVEARGERLERHREDLERAVESRTKELREAKDTAEDATELKDKFVSLVSHDLRAPLGNITSLLSLLKDTGGEKMPTEKRKEIIDMAEHTACGLMEMIDRLLDISRLQTGKIKPQKEFLNAEAMVAYQLVQLNQVAEDKGITIENRIKDNMPIFADPALIGEVVRNIISNAIKFCNKGDNIIIYRQDGDTPTIAIKDSGVGIDKKKLGDLFRHEVKTSSIGTAGEKGTGLGLPYCMDIMKAHDGSIRVESEPGNGSCFYIEIPSGKRVIMLVEDQDVQRDIIKTMLIKEFDVDVIEMDDGMQAYKQLITFTPDLIISDIHMPNMNGVELLQKARGNEKTKSLPMILCSSEKHYPGAEGDLHDWLVKQGANDFLLKPLIVKEVIKSVNRFLPRRDEE